MPRLDRLPQLNRNTLLMLPVQVNDTAPFTPLTRPLFTWGKATPLALQQLRCNLPDYRHYTLC